MATPATHIVAVTAESYHPRLVENFVKVTPLFGLLYPRRNKAHSSEIINAPVQLAATGNTGYRNRGEAATTASVNAERRGQWQMAEYWFGYGVDEQDIAYTSGPEAVVSLLESRKAIIVAEGRDGLSTEFLNANDSIANAPSIEGIRTIMSTTAKNGQLDPATFANWQPNSPALLTANTMKESDLAILIKQADNNWPGGKKIVLTNDFVWSAIFKLVQANQRFIEDKELVQMGWPNFTVMGVPVVSEPRVTGTSRTSTDNHIYVITLDAMELCVNPNMDMKRYEWRTRELAFIEETHTLLQSIVTRRNAMSFRTDIKPSLS